MGHKLWPVVFGAWSAVWLAGEVCAAQIEWLANVTRLTGEVKIVRTGSPIIRPVLVANEVQRGGLLSGDRVITEGGSSATISFSDGSSLELEANAKVGISERETGAQTPDGKPLRERTIILRQGKMHWKIVRNPAVTTCVDLPSGNATVADAAGFFAVEGSAGHLMVSFGLAPSDAEADLKMRLGVNLFCRGREISVATANLMPGQAGAYWVSGDKLLCSALPTSSPFEILVPGGGSFRLGPMGTVQLRVSPALLSNENRIYARAIEGETVVKVPGKQLLLRPEREEIQVGFVPKQPVEYLASPK